METTTNIKKIKNGTAKFTWGSVVKIFEIGEYDIVKSLDDEGGSSFHCWVNGKDTHRSCSSLDKALVFCVAYKKDGESTKAHEYFMKMVENN